MCVCERKSGSGPNHCEAREGGIKTFLNLKRFFALTLFYYLHDYFKYMSIILFSIHRVACNYIFRGDNPQIGGVMSPPSPPGFTPMIATATKTLNDCLIIN